MTEQRPTSGDGQASPRPHKRQDTPKPRMRPAGNVKRAGSAAVTPRSTGTAASRGSGTGTAASRGGSATTRSAQPQRTAAQPQGSTARPQSQQSQRSRQAGQQAQPRGGQSGATPHARLAQHPTASPRAASAPASGPQQQPAGTRPRGGASATPPQSRRSAPPAEAPHRRVQPRFIAAIAVALVLGIGIVALISTCSSSATTASSSAAETEEEAAVTVTAVGAYTSPTSTPASEWTAGVMPHLYQTDAAWADLSYASSTIAQNGYGPACLAMVYIYLTGNTDMGVVEMCAYAEENGYAPSGSTEWSFLTTGASELGLSSEALIRTRDAFTEALEAGSPIICSMQPGTFTKTGQYIVVAAIDENGMCMVYDPSSSYRSAQLWPVQTILTECTMAWAYTVSAEA